MSKMLHLCYAYLQSWTIPWSPLNFCRSGKTPIRSRSSRLPDFLAQNIEQHFKVPVQFQVLCHLAAVVPGPIG